jgi:hypothetical protein
MARRPAATQTQIEKAIMAARKCGAAVEIALDGTIRIVVIDEQKEQADNASLNPVPKAKAEIVL